METIEIVNDTTTRLIISCIRNDKYLNTLYSKLDNLYSSEILVTKVSKGEYEAGFSDEINNKINELCEEIISRVEEITLFYKNKSYLNKLIHFDNLPLSKGVKEMLIKLAIDNSDKTIIDGTEDLPACNCV